MANTHDVLNAILQHLRPVHIDRAVAVAQTWLDQATGDDIAGILAACPAASRPRLVSLLKALLTGNPFLLGAPVLIRADYATTEGLDGSGAYENGYVLANELRLPTPCDGLSHLDPELTFLGWAPDSLRSRARTVAHISARRAIPWEQVSVRIALFEFRPRMLVSFDELPEISPAWWGLLFSEVLDFAKISLCELPLLPYPEAVDVANDLNAWVAGVQPPGEHYFADEALMARCRQRISASLPPSTNRASR